MLKKFAKLISTVFFLISFVMPVSAQEKYVNVYFFWGDGCPHCADEKPFLEEIEEKYPEVEVHDYEIWGSRINKKYLVETGKRLDANVSGVPFTVIGEKTFSGYNESLTPVGIEEQIKYCLSNECNDPVADVVGISSGSESEQPTTTSGGESGNDIMPEKINFPVIGEIKTKNLSLPVFTIVLGALDGFNPCAMWTLIFLIGLLLGMENKRRRWILGIAFIMASAFVYFLFMAAWLNIILFIGFIIWIRILIGLVAIGGGGYNLKEFFTNKEAACKVTGGEKRQKVFERLKDITHQRKFFVALGGIILLAFAVNLVELICSAGLPVVFTQVLALSELTKPQYYGYMLLYIFIFMLDDLFVFFTAMVTLEMTGMSTKYVRASHLIGGFLMLIMGLLLIFKPEVLMFG